MTASELFERRANLLQELENIEQALAYLECGEPVAIRTHKNLRNTYLGNVPVYADKALTRFQKSARHTGWVCAEDAAWLRVNFADEIENEYLTLRKVDK